VSQRGKMPVMGGNRDTRASDRPAAPSSASRPFWTRLPFLLVIAVVLSLLIKSFLVQAFYIPSASMEDTLQGGNPVCSDCGTSPGHPFDRVLVNKLVYDFRSPRRGEIVVFRRPPGWPAEGQDATSGNPVLRFFRDVGSVVGVAPPSDDDFIKRIIGVAGDHVVCCDGRRRILVNGKPLTEPYLYLRTASASQHAMAYTPFNITVPRGDLFVVGDHRDDSSDSRVNGPVPVGDVVGRAFVVIWPISDWRTLPVPETFSATARR
jgi:signal peptidase I